ncbi:MAG: hypothetical protein ACD_42C00435G0001, partial [uncultured bacterium]
LSHLAATVIVVGPTKTPSVGAYLIRAAMSPHVKK